MVAEAESTSCGLSHDMRQPLRSMRQCSRILLEDYAGHLDETARYYLDRLIQDVLTLSRLSRQEIDLRRVDLEPLVDDILRH